MALTGTSRGAGSTNTAAQNTLVITPASNLAAGSLAVLAVAYDNSGGSGADPYSAIVDSVGNTWTSQVNSLNDPGAANAGMTARIFTAFLKTALTTANTITVSFGGITTVARAWTLDEVRSDTAGRYAIQIASGQATGSSTTPAAPATASLATGEMVIGMMAGQGNAAITADSDTSNGSWSTQQTSAVGVTTAGVEIASQRKIVTGAGAQTYNTTITSAVWCACYITFRELATVANIPGVFADYDGGAGVSATGGLVDSWADQSGNSRTLTQTGAQRFTTGTRTSPSGRNMLDIPGPDNYMVSGALTLAQTIEVFAYLRSDTTSYASDGWFIGFEPTMAAPVGIESTGNWGYYAGTDVDSGVAADTNPHLMTAVLASGFSSLRRDGTTISTGNPGSQGLGPSDQIIIGSFVVGTHDVDGAVGEVLIVSGAIGGGTSLETIEAFLTDRWVTASVSDTAPAESPTVTFTADNASASIATPVENPQATATFTASNATVVTGATAIAESATVTFTGQDASSSVSTPAGSGTVTFTGQDATATTATSATAESATVTFTASDATVSTLTMTQAAAVTANVTFTGHDGAGVNVAPAAGLATVAFTVDAVTAITAAVANAGAGTVTFTGQGVTADVKASAESPAVAFTAYVVGSGRTPESATVTFTGQTLSSIVAPNAELAVVTFVAADHVAEVPEPPPPLVPITYGPPASARWLGRVSETHEVVTRAHIFRRDIAEPFAEYPVLEGSVTIAARDEVHRSGELVIGADFAGDEIAPDVAGDIFAPTRAEIQIYSGVRYADGTLELMGIARMVVEEYEMTPSTEGRKHRLTLFDRSQRIRGEFGKLFTISPGTPVELAVERIVHHKAPTLPVELPETGDVTPLLAYAPGDDCWQKAQGLMRSSGFELTCSRFGTITADKAVLLPSQQPDWTLIEDGRDVAYGVSRKLKGADVPNHVVVTSSRQGSSARGEAFDVDPTSPTWIKGPHGDVLYTHPDPNITTNEQATRAAAMILARKAGLAESNSATVLPNPAMSADHTIRAVRPSMGLDALLLVDQIELALSGGAAMSVEFRRGVKSDDELIGAIAP